LFMISQAFWAWSLWVIIVETKVKNYS
jgi:hypothetical protein